MTRERVRLVRGDCREVMRSMNAGSIDAIVCDPPYGISFMGKGWDHGVPSVEFWTEALRVAKPGAHLVAFGGTRTYHRLVVAIEDAGWEIHDCLSWLYGSGFPKHVSKLKPAWEPITLARKPAKNATPLNIDACRIAGEHIHTTRNTALGVMNDDGWKPRPGEFNSHAAGRWPANVVLDEEAGAMLDAQSGELTSGSVTAGRPHGTNFAQTHPRIAGTGREASSGGASRFFYCAKASRRERGEGNIHPTVKPLALMRWLVRLVTPPNGVVLDPFMGSGSTGVAAIAEGFRFVGCELDAEYVSIAHARIARAS